MAAPHRSLAALGERAAEISALHLESAFRRLLRPQRSEAVEFGDGWLRVCTGATHPFGNMVLGLAPDDVPGLLEAAEPFLRLGVPSSVVYTHPEISEEAHERLVSLGFEQHDAMPAMAVDVAALAPTTLPEGCELLRVGGGPEAEEWVEALAEGYEIPLEVAALFSPEFHAGSRRLSFWAAVEDGRMVATSTLWLADGVAGIYCVATRHGERRRGLGAHLTAEPLRRAAAEGWAVGVLQSSPAGLPVYRRLGFQELAEVSMYLRMPG